MRVCSKQRASGVPSFATNPKNKLRDAASTFESDQAMFSLICWCFNSPFGQRQIINNAPATRLPILNKSWFEALPIPIPPLAEQTRIVAEVERRLSVVEELEAVVSANLQRAIRLRQSILQKAFAGQLRFADQPPPWGPVTHTSTESPKRHEASL